MITVIVGHRGTGKTSFLKRLVNYFDSILIFDLDTEIAKRQNRSISEIFSALGEDVFRKIELDVFNSLLEENKNSNVDIYISLGAGFKIESLPSNIKILWLRRVTDNEGRIFLNRPRLEKDTPPLVEWQNRFQIREEKFKQFSHEQLFLPEGIDLPNQYEKQILTGDWQNLNLSLTVLPEHIKNDLSLKFFLQRFLNKGLKFELRTDLLSPHQISNLNQKLSKEKIIFSLRTKNFQNLDLVSNYQYIDWAIELGKPTSSFTNSQAKKIISFHDAINVSDGIEQMNSYASFGCHLKFSPLVNNISDIVKGIEWQRKDPNNRSFLPRSSDGRWAWVRILLAKEQLINFFKDSNGSALDQPTLFQFLSLPKSNFEKFAAVLGKPVHHSYSPIYHLDFFNKFNMPFFAIQLDKEEFIDGIKSLLKLGLVAAAVTSPLKELAFSICTQTTPPAHKFKSANTLFIDKTSVMGHNTDVDGFRALVSQVQTDQNFAVWGGGGTLPIIEHVLPNATFYESRTGQIRNRISSQFKNPDIVVWAALRTNDTLMPPLIWHPKYVIDLNYKEDSMGLEYAQKIKANYLSGLEMFIVQAKAQQQWWKVNLRT